MPEFTFVCCASVDAALAQRLADFLRLHGVRVALASTLAGDAAARERETAATIRQCGFFVLVVSAAALDAWDVRDQTLLAERTAKKIILVRVEPCPLPAVLASHPVVELTRGRWHRRAALFELLAQLNVPAAPAEARRRDWLLEFGWQPRPLLLLWLVLGAVLTAIVIWRWPQDSGPTMAFSAAPPVRPAQVIEPKTAGAPNPQPTPIDTHIRPLDGKKMVFVPAGDFLMGTPNDDSAAPLDEQPQLLVYVDDFWLDQTEVTNAQYRQCVTAGRCSPSTEKREDFVSPQYPVVGVNWEQAHDYCRWVGARLPTEAEWEKAARGLDGRHYPWGDAFDSRRLNYCDSNCIADWRDFSGNDGYRYTAPVFAYPLGASPYGALNMSGNVWEWVADWYAPDAYQQAAYRNPTGPPTGQQRVIRGGSWLYNGRNVRVTRRQKELPTYRYENIGFRCALSGSSPGAATE